jgi:hypothetical protein
MAAGDMLCVFYPQDVEPSNNVDAVVKRRNHHYVLEFDDGQDEYGVFSDVMPPYYEGGNIDLYIIFACRS